MPEFQRDRFLFKEGDQVLITDRKERRYLLRLTTTGVFHSHLGNFPHSKLLGREDGTRLTTSMGHEVLAVRPTMADFTIQMPRIATVVYPKDLGAIIVYGDIFPGAKVLEAGTGSGALTIALTRAIGEHGKLVSYDIRHDMIERAQTNIEAALQDHSRLTIKEGNVYKGFVEEDLDRIVLDLPEPWHVIPHAAKALIPGRIILSFLPTVLQVHDLTNALKTNGEFALIETIEIIIRPWSVGQRNVRPAHRMVAHTGFITVARKCSPTHLSLKPTGTFESLN